MGRYALTTLQPIHIEILRRLSQGQTYATIGQEVHLATSTIGGHSMKACRILGANSIPNAIYIATKKGLI